MVNGAMNESNRSSAGGTPEPANMLTDEEQTLIDLYRQMTPSDQRNWRRVGHVLTLLESEIDGSQ